MRKEIFIGLVVLLALGLLFGCSSPPKTTVGEDGNTTGFLDNNSSTNEVLGSDANISDSTQGEIQQDSQAFADFKLMLNGLPTYYVAYNMVSPKASGTLKQWIKTEAMREDLIFSGVNSKTYFVNGKIIVCNIVVGQEMCFEQQTAQLTDTGINSAKENVNAWAAKVSALQSKTIAGVSASCYKVVDDSVEYYYCFSPESVPLFIETVTSDGTTTLTAFEYGTTVDENAFTLSLAIQSQNIPGYN